jgi:carbon-monoxide dehydrogenase large subunit
MRRKNFIPVDAMPYTNPLGEVYDSGDFNTVLDLILEQADWNGFEARKAESAKQGKLRGRGLSCYIEWTGAVWSEDVTMEASGAGNSPVIQAPRQWVKGLRLPTYSYFLKRWTCLLSNSM